MAFEIPDYLHSRVNEVISNAMVSISEVRDAVLDKIKETFLPDAKERRRYALLQASATIFAAAIQTLQLRANDVADTISNLQFTADAAVNSAGALLAEIEKREKAEAES